MLIVFLCQIHCMLKVASLTTDLQLKRPCLDLDNTTQYLTLGGLKSLNHTTGVCTATHWLVKILKLTVFRNLMVMLWMKTPSTYTFSESLIVNVAVSTYFTPSIFQDVKFFSVINASNSSKWPKFTCQSCKEVFDFSNKVWNSHKKKTTKRHHLIST